MRAEGSDTLEKKQFREIDLCRGLGIILVVLGHALKQTGTDHQAVQISISVIYSFHMPLFFVLSGFVAYRILGFVTWGERINYVAGRARRLLIPYFCVGAVYIPLKIALSRYALKPYDFSSVWRILIGDNPNTALWYLYILFWISVLSVLLARRKTFPLLLGASFLLSAAAYGLDWPLHLPRYLFFFLLGLFLREWTENRSQQALCSLLLSWKTQGPALLLFVSGNLLGWRYGGLWFLLTAVCGSFLVLGLAELLASRVSTDAVCVSLLMTAGRYSMDIYIFSEPVITAVRLVLWNLMGLPFALCILCCFLCGLIIPVPVSFLVVRRVPLFRVCLLGMDWKERSGEV